MHSVTLQLSVASLWHPKLTSSLFLSLVSFLSPSPSSIIPPTQLLSSLPPLLSRAKPVAPWLHVPFKQRPSGEHVWALRRTSRPTGLKENTKQCPSVSLSTPHHHHPEDPLIADKSNESGCPPRPWQRVWSLKCSHSPSPLCHKGLRVINNTNESDVDVFSLLVLLSLSIGHWYGQTIQCDLSTGEKKMRNILQAMWMKAQSA